MNNLRIESVSRWLHLWESFSRACIVQHQTMVQKLLKIPLDLSESIGNMSAGSSELSDRSGKELRCSGRSSSGWSSVSRSVKSSIATVQLERLRMSLKSIAGVGTQSRADYRYGTGGEPASNLYGGWAVGNLVIKHCATDEIHGRLLSTQ